MQLPAPQLFITATTIIVYYASRQLDSIIYSTNIHNKQHKISYKSKNKTSKISVFTIQYKRTYSILSV